MSIENAIGVRLREFAEQHYTSMREFADALEVSSQVLMPYLSGKRKPGNKMKERLHDLGADVDYILTGRRAAAEQKNLNAQFTVAFNYLVGKGIEDPMSYIRALEITGKKYEKLKDMISGLDGALLDTPPPPASRPVKSKPKFSKPSKGSSY